jgi:nucleoside-diphosphate-sugar epimerase
MSGLEGRRIALIGGAGFIGHNLALHLKRAGAEVSVIDGLHVNNLLSFAARSPDRHGRDLYLKIIHERLDLLHANGIAVHVQDARDYHGLSKLLGNVVKPDSIVHLAAVAHAGRSNKDPYSTFDHSLRTLENALDYSRGAELDHFVYLSSSMVYGNFDTASVTEDHPLDPLGIYGALKVSGERIVIAYNRVFGLPFTIIRPSALYGPRCVSRRVGQIFIENALKGQTLNVMGDGEERLDFTYIDDLLQGLSRVLTVPAAKGEVFNLTYGQARTLNELLSAVQAQFPEAQVARVPRDALIPFRGTLCIDKARDLLGYSPEFPLEKGIPAYVDWYGDLGR